jgi:hypothetical protein
VAPARVSRVSAVRAQASTKGVKKVVLAYSGGLDTSVILKWLQDTYNCEVVTFTADLGQVRVCWGRGGGHCVRGCAGGGRGVMSEGVATRSLCVLLVAISVVAGSSHRVGF